MPPSPSRLPPDEALLFQLAQNEFHIAGSAAQYRSQQLYGHRNRFLESEGGIQG
ncbi:hypothetical protein D3C81_1405180 [compost metagenome]